MSRPRHLAHTCIANTTLLLMASINSGHLWWIMSSSVPELCVPDLSFHLRATELKAISIFVIERIFAVRSILAIQKIFAVLIKTNTCSPHCQTMCSCSFSDKELLFFVSRTGAACINSLQEYDITAFALCIDDPFLFCIVLFKDKRRWDHQRALVINWSVLPVPECRLKLERSGSQS